MQLSAALTEFFFAKDLTPSARRWYEQKLTHFARWCEKQEGIDDVADVQAATVRRYLHHLRQTPSQRDHERPLSTQTLHGYMRVVRGFLNFCIREDWLDPKVTRRIEMPKREQKIVATFSKRDIEALFRACEDPDHPALAARDRAILAVLLDTGIRANELCSLTLDRTFLGLDDAYIIVDGKGRKQREVGLGKRSRSLLHRYIHGHRARLRAKPEQRHVFLTRFGSPLAPEGLDRMLYRLRDKTDIEGVRVSAHTFRHTMAVSYLANGGELYKLSRLLGHTSVVVTEGYLRSFKARDARRGLSVLDAL